MADDDEPRVAHGGWTLRWCPLCNRNTQVATDHAFPPMAIVTCSACGFVHAIGERRRKDLEQL